MAAVQRVTPRPAAVRDLGRGRMDCKGVGRFVVATAATAALCGLAGVAHAEAPRAAVDGDLPPELRARIVQAIGETDRPVLNRFEARRRAREAGESAVAVLRSEGYYAHEVDPDLGDGDVPAAVVRVQPGPRFKLSGARIDWQGEPPVNTVRLKAQSAMNLPDGTPGRAGDILEAEGRVVAAVQARGYADVAAEPREVVVDHADQSVRPTFHIAAGGLVRLGVIDLPQDTRTAKAWLAQLATWGPGEVYDPADVAELERRLLDTGVYDSVAVAVAAKDRTTPGGLRPVVVSVADRKPRTIEAGASYGTTEGVGLDARWTRYNLFSRADTLAIFGRLSQLDSRVGGELALPHWRRPQQTLRMGGAAYRIQTDAYDETGFGLRADVQRLFGRSRVAYLGGGATYITVGASVDFSRTDEKRPGTLTSLGRDVVTTSVLADLSLDRSDDPLDPRRGWRVSGRLEPTMLAGEVNRPYLKLTGQGSYYLPLARDGRSVIAGRLRAGLIAGGSIPEVPASRRFYAGGGGSVRGFGYQAVGPRLADNTPQGGLSLLEASLELRQKVTGPWGLVAFVDGGAVGTNEFPKGRDLSLGAGVGVRYDLGFGPIRADFAFPLDRRKGDAPYQIYISIGQSY